MIQQRLDDLMLILCEYDIKIHYDDVIKVFAKYSYFFNKLLLL